MSPTTLMISGGTILLAGLVIVIINFYLLAKSIFAGDHPSLSAFLRGTIGHLIFVIVASIGFLVLLAGFVWKMVLIVGSHPG